MTLISEIRDAWGWTGLKPAEVVGENDFGNLIIRDEAGQYWRLCPEDVYCEIVAKDESELAALSADEEFRIDWYMTALVEAAQKTVGPLQAGWKYCLVIPGVLGGQYDVSNIKSVPLIELIRFSGDLALQIRDLPEGQNVELKVID